MTHYLTRSVKTVITGALLLGSVTLVQAETSYDLVNQFSQNNNPNVTWSYGWEPFRGGMFSLLTNPYTDPTWGISHGWNDPNVGELPAVTFAQTDIYHPTVTVPAGTVNVHPGPNGENAVIRWTAPESGTYRIEGAFTGRDHAYPTSTDVALLRGPFEVFSSYLNSYNVPLPYAAHMPLIAGETVDLTVGFGNGNYYGDSTGVTGTITKVSDLACTPPPAGLIAWWTGDGTATDLVGGVTGALNNGTSYSSGLVGRAFALDGVDDFVSVPDAPAFALGAKNFTLGFWVRFNTTFGEQVMVEKYVEGWPRTGFTLTKMEDNAVRLHLADDTTSSWNTLDVLPSSIPDNTWIFVSAKREGNTFTIYWNGTAIGSTTFNQTLDLTSPASLKLGHRGNPSDTPGSWDDRGFYLNGNIDEVQLFGRALGDDEIRSLYLAAGAGECKVIADIKPGSFPNSINPASKGVIPVAILSTISFNAATVVPSSVLFGTAAPSHSSLEDVNGDGKADLLLQFPTQKTGITCGTTSVAVSGKTTDGNGFKSFDSIVTSGCK